jgi:5-aminopentanamidase
MKIALASAPFPKSLNDGLFKIKMLMGEAAAAGAAIICFPETYLPGYPLKGRMIEKPSFSQFQDALYHVSIMAAQNSIGVILPMDWIDDEGWFNLAFVIGRDGAVLGAQTKNQLDPGEDKIWLPGIRRNLFEIDGLKFGIAICHEGFRYPETVRWAAMRDAAIVFHPQCTISDQPGPQLTEWGNKDNPYYEKAMMMRAMENTIYFASVNYAMPNQESATSLIDPEGNCIAYQPYGKAGILVAEIDPAKATGLLAKRFKPEYVYGSAEIIDE